MQSRCIAEYEYEPGVELFPWSCFFQDNSAHTAAIILRPPVRPYRSIFLNIGDFLPKDAGNVAYILEKERH